MPTRNPSENDALEMAREVLPNPVTAERMLTGLQHFVFEVSGANAATVVVRASRHADLNVAQGAVYWSQLLRPRGVPLPEILHADLSMESHAFPFLILERFQGQDLGKVVNTLSVDALRELARQLESVQDKVTGLPPGAGYGFAQRLDGPFRHDTWGDLMARHIGRRRPSVDSNSFVQEALVDRAEVIRDRLQPYFTSVRATPFLHDITTKNVIMNGPRLSGIVDVDDLCFGDPLFLLGLIRMGLLAHHRPMLYADIWLELLQPDNTQKVALDLYTGCFALAFLSQIGKQANRSKPQDVEPSEIAHLESLADHYLKRAADQTQTWM